MTRPWLPVLLLSLPWAVAATAQPPSFMSAVEAYDAGDYARCADTLLAVEASGAPFARNGELLAAECLARAQRSEEAFAYLRRQLPAGRIPLEVLRDKSQPGLDALRARPEWLGFLSDAIEAEMMRVAKLDAPLRSELLRREARDQEARTAALANRGEKIDREDWRRVEAVDDDNTRWLQEVIAAKGWPDSTLVGVDGAHAAWMLLQHADRDPEFQARMLPLMEAAAARGTMAAADVAMFTDRVLLAQGKPQRYGSQFQTGDDGVMRMRPVEDEAGLDARRLAVGLYRRWPSTGSCWRTASAKRWSSCSRRPSA